MPLKKLQDAIKKDPESKHSIILSVDGNDFRVLLNAAPQKLMQEIPKVQKVFRDY